MLPARYDDDDDDDEVYIKVVCCRSKEKIKIYSLKSLGPQRDLYFFLFI